MMAALGESVPTSFFIATQSDRTANRKDSPSRRVYSAERATDTRAAKRSHDNRSATLFGRDRQRPQLGSPFGSSLQAKRASSLPGRAHWLKVRRREQRQSRLACACS